MAALDSALVLRRPFDDEPFSAVLSLYLELFEATGAKSVLVLASDDPEVDPGPDDIATSVFDRTFAGGEMHLALGYAWRLRALPDVARIDVVFLSGEGAAGSNLRARRRVTFLSAAVLYMGAGAKELASALYLMSAID